VRLSGDDWVLSATGEAGPVEIRVDRASSLLKRVSGLLPTSAGPARAELVCSPVAADPRLWVITPGERRRVASLSDLRPAEAEVAPGAALPNMGLMTPALAAFSWRDAIDAAKAQPATGRVLTALILYRASSTEAGDAAVLASGVLRAAAKDLDRRRITDRPGLPRLLIRPVAVLELSDFTPALPREIEAQWAELGEAALWTSSGQPLIDRFAAGFAGVVVLTDEDQVVRGVVPLDNPPIDDEPLLAEVRGVADDLAPPPPPLP
jgi:hypothetical protein